MPLTYFTTPRFTVRQWEPADADALFAIMSDPRVHTYTGDKPWSRERAGKYIALMLGHDFRTVEIFHGACILKATNQLVGFTGLNPYLPKQPELEWQLGVPFWDRGYATEVGLGSIQTAFATTDVKCIHAMANPENVASRRALEKIGMRPVGIQEFHGAPHMFYRIDRPQADTN